MAYSRYLFPVEMIPRVLSRGIRLGLLPEYVILEYHKATLDSRLYEEKLPLYRRMCTAVCKIERLRGTQK